MYGDSREVITEDGFKISSHLIHGKSKLLAYLAVRNFVNTVYLLAMEYYLIMRSPFKNDFAVSKKNYPRSGA